MVEHQKRVSNSRMTLLLMGSLVQARQTLTIKSIIIKYGNMDLARKYEQLAEDRPVNMQLFADKGLHDSLTTELVLARHVRSLARSAGAQETGVLDDFIRNSEAQFGRLVEEEILHTIFKRIANEIGKYVELRPFARLLREPVVTEEISGLSKEQKQKVIDGLKLQVAKRIAGTMAVIENIEQDDKRYQEFTGHLQAHVLKIIDKEMEQYK